MYELKKLIEFANKKTKDKKRLVLATIIKTIGSSYRKMGTQMIISEDLEYEGAISGGCVENEALRQAEIVFRSKGNVIFEYDGEYKLGCKGKIYVLVEFFTEEKLAILTEKFSHSFDKRFSIILGFIKDQKLSKASIYYLFGNEKLFVSNPDPSFAYDDEEEMEIKPQNQLVIVGGEYDSVSLALLADASGFLTSLFVKESFSHVLPPSIKVAYQKPEELNKAVLFDQQTAIVLMTHSLSKDLNYLIEVLKVESKYLGILGPPSRMELILNNLMDYDESLVFTHSEKLEKMYGPIGLNIGAKTPEEISISVLSEIISVFNDQKVALNI